MQTNEIKYLVFRTYISLTLIAIIISFAETGHSQQLQVGKKYKLIKPIYIMGEYNDSTNKTISKETARAYLHSVMLATRYFTAFKSEVPTGTVMTIISVSPKPWYLYFNSDYYVVTLDPDVSQGLNVELPLNSAFEGSLDGLNQEIFSPM
ncbi:MAG: hypothetical protein ABL930_10910 [Pseudobdellovibrio sp.]